MGDNDGMPRGPLARKDGLILTEAGEDLIVYDEAIAALHTLNLAMATVWEACDGTVPVAGLPDAVRAQRGLMLEHEDITLALGSLHEVNLLEPGMPLEVSRVDRRSLMKRAGAAVALPAIVSISAPLAAAATTCGPGLGLEAICNPQPDCCIPPLQCTSVPFSVGYQCA